MKSQQSHPSAEGLFRHVRFTMAVRVPLLAYQQFNRSIDEQLQELVAKWAPLAAPNATRRPRPRD
jgi:hypothetical protein